MMEFTVKEVTVFKRSASPNIFERSASPNTFFLEIYKLFNITDSANLDCQM